MTLAVETMISLAVTRVKRSSSNTPNAEASTMMSFSMNSMSLFTEELPMNTLTKARVTLFVDNRVLSVT